MKRICIILFSVAFCAFNSNIAHPQKIKGFKPHLVVEGDTLYKIAPPEHWDITKRVNRIDEGHLVIGKTILIPDNLTEALKFCPVPKNIAAAKGFDRILYVFLDIQYFGAYEKGKLLFWGPISSGRKWCETPENPKKRCDTLKGSFRVLVKKKDKISNKTYNGKHVPMPYSIQYSGHYFIHQQSLPGRKASHGCVRLLMGDAKKIFYWIKIGDPIEIKDLNELYY